MGRARSMPDEATLRRWFEADVPYKQMVELWYEMSGERSSHPAMIGKCQKYDWYVPRQGRHSGGPLTPWKDIRNEHTDCHDIQMLRKEAARRAGHVFSEKWNKRIDGFLRGLEADNCVVMYVRDSIQGFHHVPRLKTDKDYVRLPDGYEPPAAAAS